MTAKPAQIELYVYYQIAETQTGAALSAFAAAQGAAALAWPELELRLLQRSDMPSQAGATAAGAQTWMEIYRGPLAASTAAEQAMALVLNGLLAGPRHLEWFTLLRANARPDPVKPS